MNEKITKEMLCKMIDHTLLSADATENQVRKTCAEAIANKFASVCINPSRVPLVKQILLNSGVAVCTVIGFPFGAEKSSVKAFAASQAVLDGADEIDMVINIGDAKDENFDVIEQEIREVVEAARSAGKSLEKNIIVKVILETCYLSDAQIIAVCKAAMNANADFVKTSTGYGNPKSMDGSILANGASVHHVELMKSVVGDKLGIKASGGIRSARSALELVRAGATRLGTSNGPLIISQME